MRRSVSKLIADAGYAVGALQDLSRYFARILTERDCAEIVRRSLDTRESQFLRVAKHLIYETSWSPYLPLLNAAGCEYGDLEVMVRQRGLEDTLRALAGAGVCLSFEEFRGRTDVVRGSNSFRFRFQDFDNPRGRKLLQERTGGTRSVGLPVSMSLGDVAARTASFGYALHAPDARDKVPITWHTGMRIPHWLTFAKLGCPPERWFSLRDPQDPASPYLCSDGTARRALQGVTLTCPRVCDVRSRSFCPARGRAGSGKEKRMPDEHHTKSRGAIGGSGTGTGDIAGAGDFPCPF